MPSIDSVEDRVNTLRRRYVNSNRTIVNNIRGVQKLSHSVSVSPKRQRKRPLPLSPSKSKIENVPTEGGDHDLLLLTINRLDTYLPRSMVLSAINDSIDPACLLGLREEVHALRDRWSSVPLFNTPDPNQVSRSRNQEEDEAEERDYFSLPPSSALPPSFHMPQSMIDSIRGKVGSKLNKYLLYHGGHYDDYNPLPYKTYIKGKMVATTQGPSTPLSFPFSTRIGPVKRAHSYINYNFKVQSTHETHHAAILIQALARGYITRKWVWDIAGYFHSICALKIQRSYRGWRGRVIAKSRRILYTAACWTIQKKWRKVYRRRNVAADLIQRRFRVYRLRRVFLRIMEQRQNAAVLIQAAVRGSLAREKVSTIKTVRRSHAAFVIQRFVRQYIRNALGNLLSWRTSAEAALKSDPSNLPHILRFIRILHFGGHSTRTSFPGYKRWEVEICYDYYMQEINSYGMEFIKSKYLSKDDKKGKGKEKGRKEESARPRRYRSWIKKSLNKIVMNKNGLHGSEPIDKADGLMEFPSYNLLKLETSECPICQNLLPHLDSASFVRKFKAEGKDDVYLLVSIIRLYTGGVRVDVYNPSLYRQFYPFIIEECIFMEMFKNEPAILHKYVSRWPMIKQKELHEEILTTLAITYPPDAVYQWKGLGIQLGRLIDFQELKVAERAAIRLQSQYRTHVAKHKLMILKMVKKFRQYGRATGKVLYAERRRQEIMKSYFQESISLSLPKVVLGGELCSIHLQLTHGAVKFTATLLNEVHQPIVQLISADKIRTIVSHHPKFLNAELHPKLYPANVFLLRICLIIALTKEGPSTGTSKLELTSESAVVLEQHLPRNNRYETGYDAIINHVITMNNNYKENLRAVDEMQTVVFGNIGILLTCLETGKMTLKAIDDKLYECTDIQAMSAEINRGSILVESAKVQGFSSNLFVCLTHTIHLGKTYVELYHEWNNFQRGVQSFFSILTDGFKYIMSSYTDDSTRDISTKATETLLLLKHIAAGAAMGRDQACGNLLRAYITKNDDAKVAEEEKIVAPYQDLIKFGDELRALIAAHYEHEHANSIVTTQFVHVFAAIVGAVTEDIATIYQSFTESVAVVKGVVVSYSENTQVAKVAKPETRKKIEALLSKVMLQLEADLDTSRDKRRGICGTIMGHLQYLGKHKLNDDVGIQRVEDFSLFLEGTTSSFEVGNFEYLIDMYSSALPLPNGRDFGYLLDITNGFKDEGNKIRRIVEDSFIPNVTEFSTIYYNLLQPLYAAVRSEVKASAAPKEEGVFSFRSQKSSSGKGSLFSRAFSSFKEKDLGAVDHTTASTINTADGEKSKVVVSPKAVPKPRQNKFRKLDPALRANWKNKNGKIFNFEDEETKCRDRSAPDNMPPLVPKLAHAYQITDRLHLVRQITTGDLPDPAEVSVEELHSMAKYLGVDPVIDQDVMAIVTEACLSPLPKNYSWTPYTSAYGKVFVVDPTQKQASWVLPSDIYFYNLLRRKKPSLLQRFDLDAAELDIENPKFEGKLLVRSF